MIKPQVVLSTLKETYTVNIAENTVSSSNLPVAGTRLTEVVEMYVPHLRGGGNDSDDSDSGYEADREKNDNESADEASDDERSSGGQEDAWADYYEDSDGDSDNCYTSDNGNSSS